MENLAPYLLRAVERITPRMGVTLGRSPEGLELSSAAPIQSELLPAGSDFRRGFCSLGTNAAPATFQAPYFLFRFAGESVPNGATLLTEWRTWIKRASSGGQAALERVDDVITAERYRAFEAADQLRMGAFDPFSQHFLAAGGKGKLRLTDLDDGVFLLTRAFPAAGAVHEDLWREAEKFLARQGASLMLITPNKINLSAQGFRAGPVLQVLAIQECA